MIDELSIIQKAEDLLISNIENEAVILGINIRKYFGLNQIGTEIWERLNQPIRVSELISDLVDIYKENPEIIRNDLIEFLNVLKDKSLINVVNENHH